MKTKIKRHSRSALSILLTVCMLISCMTVGLIATDAAKVTDSGTVGATADDDSVGADKVYITYVPDVSTYDNYWWFDGVNKQEMTGSGSVYTYTFPTDGATLEANTTYRFQIMVGDQHWVLDVESVVDDTEYLLYKYTNNDNHHSVNYATGTKSTITVTFDTSTNKISFSSTDPELTSYTYYIDGRFAVWNSTRTTRTATKMENSTVEWDQKSKYIPFTETSTAGLYKVDTYSTIAELSQNTNNSEWFFFVGRSTNGGNIDEWYEPSAATNLTERDSDVNKPVTLYSSHTNAFLFNDSSNTNTNYVTIYFNVNTEKLYFHVDPMTSHTVTLKLGDTTNSTWSDGTTADKTLTVSGTTTLPSVTVSSGYMFENWTVTNDGGGTATLSNATNNGSATIAVDNDSVVLTANVTQVSETVVYVAKNDNVSKIYAWNSDGNISAAFPGDQFEQENGSAKVYNIGGVAYYKYTVNTGTIAFNFIVNNGSNARQSNNAENYAAGHTYYVQWYGTETKVDVKKMGTDWYPKYYLAYKPSSAENTAANWTRVAFSNSEATLSSLTAQNYVFYIVRQDMVNSSYEDHYWYNNGDKTITRSNRTNVYTTHNNNAPNITLTADAPGDYKVVFDAMNGDAAVTIHADYPVGYRAVGNATFFGTAWDTTSSNYEYMLTPLASAYTYNGNEYTYSCSKTMNSSVGTFEFKVWDTNDVWHPGDVGTDISVTNGVKRGQTITFYYNPDTGNVAYEITGTADPEAWPPTEIQNKMDDSSNPLVQIDRNAYPDQYTDTLIYKIATGSNAIASSPSTFSPLYQKAHPGDDGAWWADFTSVLPSVGTDQLYFNITSNGSYTGFYSTDDMTFNTDEAPGITVKKTDKDDKKFVEVSGVDSRVTNLGVYITKDTSSNFTYKFFTIKGSTSASKTVKIYAKDGAIRRNGTARDPKSNMDYSTFEKYANTFIYSDSRYTTRFTGTVRSSTHGATGNDELTDNIVPVEAFYNCSSLEKIELSANLKSIQSNAFAGCTSLKYLVLFDTVTYIAPNAFDGDTNLTLGVYYDSYAYHYARDNSVPYKLLDGVKLGDVDKDGEITINDATFIQRYLAELENLKGIYLYAADANKDGEVDISDATTIQLSVAECPVPYPVGEVITE